MPRDLDKAQQAALEAAREGFREQGFEPAAIVVSAVIPGDDADSFDYTTAISDPTPDKLTHRHREILQNSLTASAVSLED